MDVYRINEYDWYAANSFEEAVSVALKQTGLSEDELLDGCGSKEPCNLDIEVWTDERRISKTSLRKIVQEMKEPGFCVGLEW